MSSLVLPAHEVLILKNPIPGSTLVLILEEYCHTAKLPSGPVEPEGPAEPEGPTTPEILIKASPLVLVKLVIPDPVKFKIVAVPKSELAE